MPFTVEHSIKVECLALKRNFKNLCVRLIIVDLISQTHVGTHGKHSEGHCYVSPKLLETMNLANSKATLQ